MRAWSLWVFLYTVSIGLFTSACANSPSQPPSGQQVFETHCAACHGLLGAGDGPVAATMRVSVPDLRGLVERYGGAFSEDQVASYIDGRNLPDAHGERAMPVWGRVFAFTEAIVPGAENPALRIQSLLDYLRTLQYP